MSEFGGVFRCSVERRRRVEGEDEKREEAHRVSVEAGNEGLNQSHFLRDRGGQRRR